MMRGVLIVLALGLLVSPAAAEEAKGIMPAAMARMARHPVKISVQIKAADGTLGRAPEGTNVGLRLYSDGIKLREYTGKLNVEGAITFARIPAIPRSMAKVTYLPWVLSDGVRYRFMLDRPPTAPGPNGPVSTELVIEAVTTALTDLRIEHTLVELFPDEENLVVRHKMALSNLGTATVNLAAQPGGGLKLPCPVGAKHPNLNKADKDMLEVRGTDVLFKGALLPGDTQTFTVFYNIDYKHDLFEWSQTMPVPVTRALIVAPQDKGAKQQIEIPLKLSTRGAMGTIAPHKAQGGQAFEVFRLSGGATVLQAGEAMTLALSGLPVKDPTPLWFTLFFSIAAIVGVVFGLKRPAGGGEVRSRAHLVAERDRMVRALTRLRRAHEKGRLSKGRFQRESEAVTARLVTLYKALDRFSEKT